MIQDLANQVVNDYNSGIPIYRLAKKYRMQHSIVKVLLENCGTPLRRPQHKTEEELIALAKSMPFEEMAEYLFVQPLTLKRHLRKRKIKLPIFKTKDELYIEKQVKYLYLRERLSAVRIARSLNTEVGRVSKIINKIEDAINRNPEGNLMSIGESGGKFIEYHDLANVFPKQRQYARAY